MASPILRSLALALAVPLARLYLWLVRSTSRIVIRGGEIRESVRASGEGAVYALWHENILLGSAVFRGQGVAVLVSRSADGELIARFARSLGFDCVRGSSSRGGAAALRELARQVREGREAAITPDGPRGPARKVQQGVVALAVLSGRPIVPMGFLATRHHRFGSWDGTILPLPFGRIEARFGDPIHPAGVTEAELQRVEDAMIGMLSTSRGPS